MRPLMKVRKLFSILELLGSFGSNPRTCFTITLNENYKKKKKKQETLILLHSVKIKHDQLVQQNIYIRYLSCVFTKDDFVMFVFPPTHNPNCSFLNVNEVIRA